MTRAAAAVLALWAAGAAATEVTVLRPMSSIADDWPYYIMVGDKPVSDLRVGERVTVQIPPEQRALVIHCPKSFGGYEESRLDYDFKSNPTAFFVLNAKPTCVSIQAVDARGVSSALRQTRPRVSRAVEYDPGPIAGAAAPAAAAPAATTAAASKDPVAAATAAWVDAFNSRDATKLAALYDAEAVLTDTSEPQSRVGTAAIADYYKKVTQRPTQRVALGERNVRVYGDTAIDSGTYTFFEMRDGNATMTPARYTMVYRHRGGKWLIVEHHSSPAPR